MNHQERARKLFVQDHYRCSQAVLGAFGEELGLSREQSLKISGCFGSGMCMGETWRLCHRGPDGPGAEIRSQRCGG